MLESVVRVIDRFTDLLKYREVKQKEFFKEVIEPLFADLLVMHADYMKIFDDCRSQLLNTSIPLSDIAEVLRQRRQTYDGMRIKTRAILEGLKTSQLEPEIQRLLELAAHHLPDGKLGPVRSTPASIILSKLYDAPAQLLDLPRDSGSSIVGHRRTVLDLVIDTSNRLREHWSWICEEYARLKVWALR